MVTLNIWLFLAFLLTCFRLYAKVSLQVGSQSDCIIIAFLLTFTVFSFFGKHSPAYFTCSKKTVLQASTVTVYSLLNGCFTDFVHFIFYQIYAVHSYMKSFTQIYNQQNSLSLSSIAHISKLISSNRNLHIRKSPSYQNYFKL